MKGESKLVQSYLHPPLSIPIPLHRILAVQLAPCINNLLVPFFHSSSHSAVEFHRNEHQIVPIVTHAREHQFNLRLCSAPSPQHTHSAVGANHRLPVYGYIKWIQIKLKEYFQGYGEVVQAVVMRDKVSGKPRGFGFVVFSDPEILDRVLQDSHVIDGRTVEAKRALSRDEQQGSRGGNSGGVRSFGGGGGRTKKIFVGGLPPTLSEDGFRQYFETYGEVTDVVIMYDQQTNRPRGFGFISFDSEDAVDRVLHKTFHDLNGKQVEVKRAQPKDSNSGGGGGRSTGGGGYQGYGGNSNSYDGRMESNRYMQSQNSGSGYPSYGSSGYNAQGYGYGPTNNSMGYGYGNYGNANPGFVGGPPGGGGYGNNPSAGYGGPPGAQRNSWGSNVPTGYGYGGGGPGTGQSPSGASGYGNQAAYGYGGYGGNEGGYGNQGGYGAVGGRAMGGPNGGSADQAGGYGNAGFNSGGYGDASQASGNYGGGYGGGGHTRPSQQ
ncbi:RNA-binding (RRM/RBD/RNP motifs) family protein [Striga asiatica]|uniref:RNA-binding (RRM/RBD/RNP motifs) family protein n=1 Tax=Striga asiatica TaxID=4170 RepID=A0A5A7R440_STRAF|nr:RNA-binding (RRM/RBD/RNP motifs) family protein [Striga asiatica]